MVVHYRNRFHRRRHKLDLVVHTHLDRKMSRRMLHYFHSLHRLLDSLRMTGNFFFYEKMKVIVLKIHEKKATKIW